MESGGKSITLKEPSAKVDSVKGAINRREEGEESEKESLLQPALPTGAIASGKKKRTGRRKVQWKDRSGKKLVEVLEFQPSDSSDSEDDLDSCICTLM